MPSLTLADGRTLAYLESGQGPVLVLLHGWAMSSAVFSELLDGLAGSHRVLAPDLPGHGFSSDTAAFGLDECAADIVQWLEALKIEHLMLGGWSLGGQIALRLVKRISQRIERLLLMATTPKFTLSDDWVHGLPETQVRSLKRNVQRAPEKTFGDFFALQFSPNEVSPQRYREIIAFAVRAGRLPTLATALCGLETLQTVDLREEVKNLGCPTLVVHGSEDPITPVGAGRFLASSIPAARLCELPRIGHAPFLSRPDVIVPLCREFFA